MLDTWNDSRDYSSASPKNVSHLANATNKSYAKFVDSLGDRSLWATNLLEMGQSVDMITRRALQLKRFVTKLNHFDFFGAGRELGLPKDRAIAKNLKRESKAFANNFLEYHFGWEPLVKDIYAATESVTNPFKPKRYRGRGRYSDQVVSYGNGSMFITKTESKCQHQADISVSNPNALLMSQLGLVNPASVVWEAVKFSFVVDWFANVGQVLSSMTDFVGLSLTNSFTSTSQKITVDEYYYSWSSSVPSVRLLTQHIVTQGVYVNRSLGITGPVLAIKPFKGLSVTRGATAIALLLQQMR
jgi:hypothetical protein